MAGVFSYSPRLSSVLEYILLPSLLFMKSTLEYIWYKIEAVFFFFLTG